VKSSSASPLRCSMPHNSRCAFMATPRGPGASSSPSRFRRLAPRALR
jgi:hypothetical protein